MQSAFRVLFFVILAIAIPRGYHKIKGPGVQQFSRVCAKVAQDSPDTVTEAILLQPFTYLGRGSQFFVYISQDRKYVLKVPRAAKLRESFIGRLLCMRVQKPDLLQSLQIASRDLAFETSLLYVHYGYCEGWSRPVRFLNRCKRAEKVDVSKIPFVLQKKIELIGESLVRANGSQERQRIVTGYLDLIERERQLGWMSDDCSFWQNAGIDDARIVRIDIGSYVSAKTFSWQEMSKPVRNWLQKADPALAVWLNKEIVRREAALKNVQSRVQ
jgi:hypothetical protein